MNIEAKEVTLRDLVWDRILTREEADVIQRMRDSGAVPFVTVTANGSADPLTEDQCARLIAMVKEATGASKVLFLPPGYSLEK